MRYLVRMRMIRVFLTTLIAIGLVAGTVYAWKNKALISNLPPLNLRKEKTSKENDGSILGAVQEKTESVSKILQDTVGKTVGDVASQFMTEDQKIEIDKALKNVQDQAVGIPENVYQQARFEYCKQVVDDYAHR